jgi:phosphoribosylglycinamide formyltransferase-1
MIRLGVLISGSGTNLQAIIDAIAAGKLDASIELVVSSRPDAYGLKRAQEAGIPTIALSKEVYKEPLAADVLIRNELMAAGKDKAGGATGVASGIASGIAIGVAADIATGIASGIAASAATSTSAGVDYVVMAGYMRMVGRPLLEAFPNRIVNIHPALLPAFIGAHGIADAFAYGVKLTGITVHFANAEYDKGPIIAQRAIPIEEGDTLESLEERIHQTEHVLYPEVLQLLAEDRVSVDDHGKVHIA